MLGLHRYSFRQLLLVTFLLIAALLGAASLRGLVALEGLLKRSGEGAREAVASTASAQQLAERSVAMERAARQYLVLDDPVLKQRFDDAAREALEALQRLDDPRIPPEPARAWRAALDTLQTQLRGPTHTLRAREATLAAAFREIESLNETLADQVRAAADARNQALLQELESGRLQLARQVLAAIAVAVVLALGFGVWLARPLKRVETAIVGLGENRLDEPIEIRGPDDVRMIGRRLEWLRLRLAELDADKARFLRHVSHELKTPLAALREGVALLEEQVAGPLTDQQREVARILRDNAALLQAQIEDLLRFNAAAFEARRLTRRKTELVALVNELVNQQRLQWQAKQLSVQVHGRPLWVEVDPDKLGAALGNLLSNAIRFSPPGSTIRWSVSSLPGRACLDIVDAGPGIAKPDRARVFEPFYRGERQPPDAPRGSGIGLSIVQEYITAHGGQIELMPEGPQGPGAHFHIELPHAS
jgi:two-component system sensor histidine kinase GlrK